MTFSEFKQRFEHLRATMGGVRRMEPGHPSYDKELKDRLDEAATVGRFRYGPSVLTVTAGTYLVDLRGAPEDEAGWVRVVEIDKVFVDGRQLGEYSNASTTIEELARNEGAVWIDREGKVDRWYHSPPHNIGLFPIPAEDAELKILGHLMPNRPADDAAELEIPLELHDATVAFAAAKMAMADGAAGDIESRWVTAYMELERSAGNARGQTNLPMRRGYGRRTIQL